ncbi:hypothetical protein Pint_22384 [Pistacia integerrima]|uniref:Uncharacterized protein n=1 Tax=Pistacia integerrima TaxID=434235 RepID=A0ACC0YI97_9ROSI|nr:hypothetical protein Pint_22384 [Pistacia integerrima]
MDLECDHLISLAKSELKRSDVADNLSGESKLSEVRTSSGMFIAKVKQLPSLQRLFIVENGILNADVAKSSLWFGLRCLCFLSSCFTKGVSFSILPAISQLGLLFLGASFSSNSILQRNNDEKKREFKLKEDDILRFGRLILPATILEISKTRELFSGEPSTTLKSSSIFASRSLVWPYYNNAEGFLLLGFLSHNEQYWALSCC